MSPAGLLPAPMRPMGVAVHRKRGKPWLRLGARKSLFGDGMLDRARATSLALLGATAALGLAMVALALNQNWPLIPGAPIPGFGDQQAAIGDAAVAAGAKASSDRGAALPGPVGRRGTETSIRPPGKEAGGTPTSAGSQPPPSESVVVSDSAPASSPVDGSGGGASPAPPPATQQPVATPVPVPAPASTPEVSSSPPPPAESASAPPVQSPVPAAGNPPAESPEEVDDGDDPQEEEGEEWDGDTDHSGGYRGHGHAYGHSHWH